MQFRLGAKLLLLVLMLGSVCSGCGWGAYDSRLQQSINERKSGGGGAEEEEPSEDPMAEELEGDGSSE